MTLKHVIVGEIWMFALPRPVTSQNDGKHSDRRLRTTVVNQSTLMSLLRNIYVSNDKKARRSTFDWYGVTIPNFGLVWRPPNTCHTASGAPDIIYFPPNLKLIRPFVTEI